MEMSRIWLVGFGIFWVYFGCAMGSKTAQPPVDRFKQAGQAEVEASLKDFIEKHVGRVAPLEKELNLAYWKATNTGNQGAYERVSQLELEIRKIYADRKSFAFLNQVTQSKKIKNPQLGRQLEILYLSFKENQVEPQLLAKMVNLSTQIQKTFNDYRGTVDGKKVSDNDIYDILKSVRDSRKRKAAWEAYKARGRLVKDKLLKLVRLRNLAARQLGYANFYEMRLKLIEQDPAQIKRIFDQLAKATDKPFAALMHKVHGKLAERYGISPKELRPWHFEDPFFQEAPSIGQVDLDRFFVKHDPRVLVDQFYQGIGLEPGDILERSDLYEKEGKMPHAYCMHVDRAGDVRILANLRPSEKWTSTLMHEMGHAVYDKFIDLELPWLLREPSHSFTTEAVAEFFGRLTRSPTWLKSTLKLPPSEIDPLVKDIDFQLRLSMLVFARWTMVMANFERQLYADPEQDLNKLWWNLKKRYQLLTSPKGRDASDWASKIHIASWPAYYHNYLLGELMVSQILYDMAKKIFNRQDVDAIDITGRAEVGRYLKENILRPGKSLRWDQLLKRTTGESLNPQYFVKQFLR